MFASLSFPSICERLKTAPFDDFDPVLNHRHLQECLHKLLRVYAMNGGTDRRAQLEFAVYYMLDHLGMCLGYIWHRLLVCSAVVCSVDWRVSCFCSSSISLLFIYVFPGQSEAFCHYFTATQQEIEWGCEGTRWLLLDLHAVLLLFGQLRWWCTAEDRIQAECSISAGQLCSFLPPGKESASIGTMCTAAKGGPCEMVCLWHRRGVGRCVYLVWGALRWDWVLVKQGVSVHFPSPLGKACASWTLLTAQGMHNSL